MHTVLGDNGLFVSDATTKKEKWARVHQAVVKLGVDVSEHAIKTRLGRIVDEYKKEQAERARASGIFEYFATQKLLF